MKTATAFAGLTRIASGDLAEVTSKVRAAIEGGEGPPVLVFDDTSGEVVDPDYRALPAERGSEAPRRPGRPKLGVVAREVTLLPRHWDWLNSQPGGASVALRKLVEEARRTNAARDRVRQAQEAAYRFMSAMAGNEPGYEEALRALFGGRRESFEEHIAGWPADIREYAKRLAAGAFEGSAKNGS